jgi:hypothetical protein
VANAVNVFVSYSWGVERDTGIVDELEKHCKSRHIRLLRDNNQIKHGELIQQFMDKLTGGEHVITVFSKLYFQSKWCMYELLTTWQRGDFQQRTHPIIADDCDLQDKKFRLSLIDYWEEQFEAAKADLADRDPLLVLDEHEEVKLYRDIHQNINKLVKFAASRLTKSLADLKAQNYAPLLDNIAPLLPDHTQLPAKADSEFLKYVKTKITEELSVTDVTVFTDVVRAELNQILDGLGEPERKVPEHNPKETATALVWLLANGKEQVPVINKVLLNAFKHCFDRKGRKYAVAQPYHEAIKDAVGQLLGWLVLASLDETQAAALAPAQGYGQGLYFELPVKTQCGVEIIVSRQHQRRANLEPAGSEVAGCHVLCASASQFSWQDAATADDLKRMLWNKVFPEETQDGSLNKNQVERLNAELQTRRLDEWDTEHHYIAIQSDGAGDDAAYQGVYKQLLTEMDQLTLVRFGVADKQAVFCMPEYNLMSAINHFLNKVNKMV